MIERKKRLSLISTLLFAGFIISTCAQELSIPDPGLNAAIRDALQKPGGSLTEADLLSLTNLNASRRSVRSLQGLQSARNLVSLDLQQNKLTDFSLPSELTNLVTLDLSINSLTNCFIPTGLDLSLNQLTNLVLPSDLSHLETLNLGGNHLSSINLPAGMTNLTGLFVTGNQLAELTLPPDMTELVSLGFLGNPLTTLVLSEPLATANLADTLAVLRSQAVSVFTYPLTFQLIRPRKSVGAFQLAITGPPGIFVVLGSTDFADWTELGTVTNTLGTVVFTDVQANLSLQRFYRAEPVL